MTKLLYKSKRLPEKHKCHLKDRLESNQIWDGRGRGNLYTHFYKAILNEFINDKKVQLQIKVKKTETITYIVFQKNGIKKKKDS